MRLFDLFKKRPLNSGKYLELLPIGFNEIEDLIRGKPTNELPDPIKYGGARAAINYAFFNNLFSGTYQVNFDEEDHGYKPILTPTGSALKKMTTAVQLTFPQDSVREKNGACSYFEADARHWDINYSFNPMLFCCFPIGKKIVPARIYLEAKNNRGDRLSEALGSEPERVRMNYTARLYDVRIEKQDDSFIFKQWD